MCVCVCANVIFMRAAPTMKPINFQRGNFHGVINITLMYVVVSLVNVPTVVTQIISVTSKS